MREPNVSLRGGAVCAIIAGVTMIVPLVVYLYLIPAAGSSVTHAQNPVSFLPWMAEHGSVRIVLWWTICFSLLIALLGVPLALKNRLEVYVPLAAQISALAGSLGLFTIILASLMLAAGEMPLARAYVAAGAEGRSAIVAIYEWQRLVTALFFDLFGYFLLGMWIFISSIAGLRFGGLPRRIGWFGVATALTSFCFAIGYVTNITWLGETGIGMLAFFTIPAWMIWLGIVLWRTERI